MLATSPEQRMRSAAILVAAACLYAGVVVNTAWVSDDAYVTFRTVEHVFAGNGLVYNIGERVQTYTHPLWLGLLCALRPLVGGCYEAALLASMGASALAIARLATARSLSRPAAALAVLTLALSRAFVDYSTSGLENPLTHLLLILLLDRAARHDSWSGEARLPHWVWWVAGLLLLNRLDTAVLLGPWLTSAAWKAWKSSRWRGVAPIAGAFVPLVSWEVFSVVYYGFPFPNTAYAKLGAGVERIELIPHGLGYLASSLLSDPLTMVTILAAVAVAWKSAENHLRHFGQGILLHVGYLVFIGGDFMAGRFLAAPLLVAVWICARGFRPDAAPWPRAGFVLALGLLAIPNVFERAPYLPGKEPALDRFLIANERQYYFRHTGLTVAAEPADHPWAADARRASRGDSSPHVVFAAGIAGYHAAPGLHVIDVYGLLDPLLARLPLPEGRGWRAGHFQRDLPLGYEGTLRTGRSQIQDRALASYYAKLREVTSGPILTGSRARAILELNLGLTRVP